MSGYIRIPTDIIQQSDVIPSVDTYADLPDHLEHLGEFYAVVESTGIVGINRKKKGFYIAKSDGWDYLGELSPTEIEKLYESNPNTNKFTDDYKDFIDTTESHLTSAYRVLITNGDKDIDISSVTNDELRNLIGSTDNIQDQLDDKLDKVTDTTDDLNEGLVNKYFTDQRAKDAVVVEDMTGDEEDQSPSVKAVKDFINDTIKTKDGIGYIFDDSRNKYMSMTRVTQMFSYFGESQGSRYLKIGEVVAANNGFFAMRDGTITGLSMKSRNSANFITEIRKNDSTSVIYSLNVVNGSSFDGNLNIDIEEGDFIQIYINGNNIDHPVSQLEIAWRY